VIDLLNKPDEELSSLFRATIFLKLAPIMVYEVVYVHDQSILAKGGSLFISYFARSKSAEPERHITDQTAGSLSFPPSWSHLFTRSNWDAMKAAVRNIGYSRFKKVVTLKIGGNASQISADG
jgi:hypothetical protein